MAPGIKSFSHDVECSLRECFARDDIKRVEVRCNEISDSLQHEAADLPGGRFAVSPTHTGDNAWFRGSKDDILALALNEVCRAVNTYGEIPLIVHINMEIFEGAVEGRIKVARKW